MEHNDTTKDYVITALRIGLQICVVIIGWFIANLINDIKSNTSETNKKFEELRTEFNNAALNLSRKVDTLNSYYHNHEYRIEVIEKKVN